MDENIQLIAERCVKSQDIPLSELPLLIPYVESFLDNDWLEANMTEYEAWAQQNSDPFLQHNFLHRPLGFNLLVAAIWAAKYWTREHIKDTTFNPRPGARRLFNIAGAIAILELYAEEWLDQDAREHLKQRFQSTENLWGIIHELNTFAPCSMK